MHIGMITASYEPVVNGVTQMVALYEKYLTACGHQVTIFTLGKPTRGEDRCRTVRSPGLALGNTGYHLATGYSAEAQRKLRAVDILHCHHPLMSLEFARRYGQAPIIFTNHTRYDLYLSSYARIPPWLAVQLMGVTWRRLARLADAVIAPSSSIRSLLIAAGVDVTIEVIENGVEIQRFQRLSHSLSPSDLRIPEEAVVYAYVGRFAPEKNILRLMDEFRLAANRNRNIHLLGIGSGPQLKRAERLIERFGLAERAHFAGHVAPDRLPSYLALSDVFVSASVTEVHPLTALEAIAAGLPVIAFDSPGFRDIVIQDESGLLVDGDKGSLARAMVALANDDLLRERLGSGAQEASMRFEIQNTVKRTLSLYRRLLDERHRRAKPARSTDFRDRRIPGQRRVATGRILNISRSMRGKDTRG